MSQGKVKKNFPAVLNMAASGRKPMRTCIGCRVSKEKDSLIRIARQEDGKIMIDIKGTAHGRGAYICPSMECLKKAIAKKGLDRSFRTSVGREAYEMLMEGLERFAG